MFKKILIANRGEITTRIMRSCKEMGVKTVAVYSDADRTAPHVMMADEAYRIGPPPARESYLKGDDIIDIAKKSGAEAIHPGYGFLAENGDFAQAVADAGLTFIGPPPDAIRTMGSKTKARQIMEDAGVPIVPGEQSNFENHADALMAAERIGYPILIKAAMGGGGKGMRVVLKPEDLPSAFDAAKREALSAFNDDTIFLERYVEISRHIEIQVLADSHGNCIHLYERECSIQRRHQKVIEEAPSAVLADQPELRERMGKAAVAAAQACGYVNAGTVEFLYDQGRNDFYFLEMNTRLQVEHPVTEMVTGIDLVREQLLVASGEVLQIKQEDVAHTGHSIECRIYAEDAPGGFLPDAGTITSLERPAGPWVRLDSGVNAGDEVGVYYDPMIAKLVTWGVDREAAIDRMHRALTEYRITGLKTTIPFSKWVMEHPVFRSGEFDTRFIAQEYHGEDAKIDERTIKAVALAVALYDRDQRAISTVSSPSNNGSNTNGHVNSWKRAGRLQSMR